MKISVEELKGDVSRIILEGRMDIAGTEAAEAEFNAAIAAAKNVIVDLGKVSFIASLGIRLLVAGAQSRSALGGKLVLMSPSDITRKVLKISGVDQLIPVCNSLDEALSLV